MTQLQLVPSCFEIVSIDDAMQYLEPEIQENIDQTISDERITNEAEKIKMAERIHKWFLDNLTDLDGMTIMPDGRVKIDYAEIYLLREEGLE